MSKLLLLELHCISRRSVAFVNSTDTGPLHWLACSTYSATGGLKRLLAIRQIWFKLDGATAAMLLLRAPFRYGRTMVRTIKPTVWAIQPSRRYPDPKLKLGLFNDS